MALEAISLAGHWKLHNLVVIYDNNQITRDGSVDLCNNENVNAKMIASGWDVMDGNYDIKGIVKVLITAKNSTEKLTFIIPVPPGRNELRRRGMRVAYWHIAFAPSSYKEEVVLFTR